VARIGKTHSRQWARPDDILREQEEAERQEALRQHVHTERETDERDLVAAANEAIAEKTAGLGGDPLTSEPIDRAIMQSSTLAGQRIEARSLTSEQRIGAAVADALISRGVVPEPPSPTVIDENYEDDSGDDEPEEEGVYGWYDSAEDTWYATDADGNFETDAAGNYISYEPGSVTDEPESDEHEADWSDVA
jgi:hypothetical protein